MAENAANIN